MSLRDRRLDSFLEGAAPLKLGSSEWMERLDEVARLLSDILERIRESGDNPKQPEESRRRRKLKTL
jgi:hypothetical protein